MKLFLMFFLGLVMMTPFLFSQEKEALAQFEASLVKASKGQNIQSLYPLVQNKNIPIGKILSIVDKYSMINNANIQREIAMLYGDIALKTETKKTKIILVHRLLSLCGDSLRYGCSEAASQLSLIKPQIFDTKAKKKIINYLNNYKYPDPDLILIAGMLDLKELVPRFNKLLTKVDSDHAKLFVRQALARMGDKESIEYFIRQYQEEQKIINFQLIDGLLYIRQPEVIPIFERILFSEGSVPTDDYDIGDPHASFGMYYLGLLLEDFPIPTCRNERSWDEANFALARQWMLANKGKYKIRRDEF